LVAVPEKSGWLSGWFKRGTSEPPETTSAPGKPIKAKLGEESSFVYDKELKRWINKKVFPEMRNHMIVPGRRCTSKSCSCSATSKETCSKRPLNSDTPSSKYYTSHYR